MKKKWEYKEAINFLKRQGLSVDEAAKKITPHKDMRVNNCYIGIGLKTWGCIDYLKGQRFIVL